MVVRKRVYILGLLIGVVAPILGLFLGLQVSVILGNILAAPQILLSTIIGEPFGTLSTVLQIAGILISVAIWTVIIGAIDRIVTKTCLCSKKK